MYIFLYYFGFVSKIWKAWTKNKIPSNSGPVKQSLDCIQSGLRPCKEEVIMVMERVGINVECDGIEEFDVQEIEQLFEKGISLGEMEEAFDVFDQNKDGFIEASELKRVLFCLGMEKDLMECKKMIDAFDQNGDHLIDLNEFVEILEQSFG
ncbi:hypothetical protein TanjilG_06735 [Lupinus angustifolius]|uniref:EF-hand domain-containing protein n=2 Tax=Lupinus angustifolius TaxID=3871 RepID=A0A1J7GNY7_LUPAN|nr:hypothetical protein TanjilG_06735 [Lupinus angustifolius]